MPEFIFVYVVGNQSSSPEEQKQHFSKYMKWLSALGDAAVSPANPFKNTQTLSPDGKVSTGSSTGISGYTLIETDSMKSALSIAKDCPFLEIGGSMEISELAEMPIKKSPPRG